MSVSKTVKGWQYGGEALSFLKAKSHDFTIVREVFVSSFVVLMWFRSNLLCPLAPGGVVPPSPRARHHCGQVSGKALVVNAKGKSEKRRQFNNTKKIVLIHALLFQVCAGRPLPRAPPVERHGHLNHRRL